MLRELPRSSSEPTSLISLDALCASLGLSHGAIVGSGAVVGSGADVGAGAAGGVEKRVDPSDGRSYTKQEFVDFYGRSTEVRWAAAKPSRARAAGAAGARAGSSAVLGAGPADAAAPSSPSSPSSPLMMTNPLTNPSPSIPPLDLIVLSCLMGNDYLPKVREATFERCWSAYRAVRRSRRFAASAVLDPSRKTIECALLLALVLVLKDVHTAATAAASQLVSAEGMSPSAARAASGGVGLEQKRLGAFAVKAVEEVERIERSNGSDHGAQACEPPVPRPLEERGFTPASAFTPTSAFTPASDEDLAPAAEFLRGVLWTVQTYADVSCPDDS